MPGISAGGDTSAIVQSSNLPYTDVSRDHDAAAPKNLTKLILLP
jgi:hypothetical protein